VWAIAAQLRALGLQTDSVIGLQLPNTVESILTLLGILRAGMIAATLPMLWRETEIVAALSAVGAKAIITAARIGTTDHLAVAGRVAAGLFSIRHVAAYGEHPGDGIVPLDPVFTARPDMVPSPQRDGNPAAHAAVVTFEPTPRGILPVSRNHVQMIAAGSAVAAAGGLPQNAVLLSATAAATLAGLGLSFAPWLITGGRLVLHHPFDPALFRDQAHTYDCDAAVVPGPLAAAFDDLPAKTALVALWRTPEWRTSVPAQRKTLDVTAFGEFGLYPALRAADGIAPLPLGPIQIAASDPSLRVETKRSGKNTLLLRGPMVAHTGLDSGELAGIAVDFVDTGYPCRIDPDLGSLIVTAPQPGMIGIGGYRIARNEIDTFAAALPTDSPIAALPDGLLGQRLRGRAADPAAAKLAARSANPQIGGAFSDPR
jgi:non-ribosomal peptide synthetase component E (peptide arylation enzyme)